MKAITPRIQAPDLTTAPGHTMEEALSWSQLAIDRTIAGRGIGTAARIISGSLVIGHGAMVSKCGFVVITSCAGTKRSPASLPRSGLPSRDQSTQQAEKSADERFQKIMAF